MTKKMTDREFAAKCDWEGLEYAVTEYGLSADYLHDDSSLRPLVERVDDVKHEWMAAIIALEDALEEVEDDDE